MRVQSFLPNIWLNTFDDDDDDIQSNRSKHRNNMDNDNMNNVGKAFSNKMYSIVFIIPRRDAADF